MSRILIFLFALLALGTTQAQSLGSIIPAMFDDLVATEVSCSEVDFTAEIAADSDDAYCGLIQDTLRYANRSIIERHLEDAGFFLSMPWELRFASPFEISGAGFMSSSWNNVAFLVELPGEDLTVVALTFHRP